MASGESVIVANTSPSSLDELEALLVLRCQELMKQHDLISGLTCYHWWPKTRRLNYKCSSELNITRASTAIPPDAMLILKLSASSGLGCDPP